MKTHPLLAPVLAIFFISQLTVAQYPYDECRWECSVAHCDYYQDYCDYECYEVCFPYSPFTRHQQVSTKGQSGPQVSDKEPEGRRTDKMVRMRISNPTFQTVRNGQITMTRGSPPRGFGLFQSCLSSWSGSSKQLQRPRASESTASV